jgi:hypothetical protein
MDSRTLKLVECDSGQMVKGPIDIQIGMFILGLAQQLAKGSSATSTPSF